MLSLDKRISDSKRVSDSDAGDFRAPGVAADFRIVRCYFLRCGKVGWRFSLTPTTPWFTSALKKPNISIASDASKAGPNILSQLLSARLVKRAACCGPS